MVSNDRSGPQNTHALIGTAGGTARGTEGLEEEAVLTNRTNYVVRVSVYP